MTKRGYGFVHAAEGDFFIPASKMGGAFDGDEVEVVRSRSASAKYRGRGREGSTDKPTGRIVKVVTRAHEYLVGRYESAEPFGIVVPVDSRIPCDVFVRREVAGSDSEPQPADGDFVRVRITEYPSARTAAFGVIEEILGHEGESGLAIEVIIARHKLETSFSQESLEQARLARVDESGARRAGYRDLCEREVFTIDPADACDFDDALSLERVGEAWRLGVHIADVSHYVGWGSSIDLDARRRATSVYLVDRAIPMLPEELSGDLCSLKPEEVRRALSIDLFLSSEGELLRYEIFLSLIRSCRRFTYDEVQALLDADSHGGFGGGSGSGSGSGGSGGGSGSGGHSDSAPDVASADVYAAATRIAKEPLSETLHALNFLARKLFEKRLCAGGIDFDTKEAKVELDEEGKPLSVVVRKRTEATGMVEEAMILANKVVAKHLRERGFPCIYRVHETPDPRDLADLVPVLHEFKYLKAMPVERFIAGDPHCIRDILEASKGRAEEELISLLILRSMKRAVYRSLCASHYGLAAKEYAHFTSPIRRYPDLVVHRMLKAWLGHLPSDFEQQKDGLPWLAEHASKMEYVAEVAGRQSQETKLVELMQDEIGRVFDAVVSGVVGFGLFVRLENTAEGLVPIHSLGNEYFTHDRKRHTLTGQESGSRYRLGQKLRVLLEEADPLRARLNFRVASLPSTSL